MTCAEASPCSRRRGGNDDNLGFDLVCERGAIRFSWERFNEIQVLTGDVTERQLTG